MKRNSTLGFLGSVVVRLLMPIVALLAGRIQSAPVTAEMAQAAAKAWCDVNGATFDVGDAVMSTRAEVADDGTLLWYEVALQKGGCLITSPDNRIEPIIAVLDTYEGGIAEGNPLRVMLAADMRKRLAVLGEETPVKAAATGSSVQTTVMATTATAASSVTQSSTRAKCKWARLAGTETGLRMTTLNASAGLGNSHPAYVVNYIYDWAQKRVTHWDQSWRNGEPCYNYYTPSNYVCGCVATAGAALLQFYGVTVAPKNVTNTCTVDDESVMLTTKGIDYDWSIVSSWDGSTATSEAQRELLGRVAYDVGVCISMDYASNGSGASQYSLSKALRDNFGFVDARYVSGIVASQYEKLIYAQLCCGAPVLLSISYYDSQNRRHGHTVVAVGYGEDADNVSYTRVFMGWGGNGDAWYALPDVDAYTTLDGITTMIGTTADTMAVYGRVTTASGIGAAQESVIAAGHSLKTGAFGHYGVRVAPNTSAKTVVFNGAVTNLTVGSDAQSTSVYMSAGTLANALPDAVNFNDASEDSLRMYSTPAEAQAAALAEGKLLFVLSGADWCANCTVVKSYLKSLGGAFTDRFLLYYCNIDCDNSGMANGTPYYGVFDPRVFSAANRWAESNGRLAVGNEGTAANVQAVLDAAWSAWMVTDRSAVSAQIVGPDGISESTDYALLITYADGVTCECSANIVWQLTDGTAASLSDHTLTPIAGQEGYVTIRADLFGHWGADLSAERTIGVFSPLAFVTESLADACAGESYQQQFAATGGCRPLSWRILPGATAAYTETIAATSTFAIAGAAMGWHGDDVKWTLELPFEFPFYGVLHSSVTVGSNGVLSFNGFNGHNANESDLKSNPMIAALWRDLKTNSGDIYVTTGTDEVTVRWQACDYWENYQYNFSVTMIRDGSIRLSYGTGNDNGGMIGVSAGDGSHYLISSRSNNGTLYCEHDILIKSTGLPAGMTLADDGTLSGTSEESGSYSILAEVTDALGSSITRTIELTVLATVEFDLGEHAVRTGGGALVQYLEDGAEAIAPTVEMDPGWTFLFWDAPLVSITGRQVIRAVCTDHLAHVVTFDIGEHGKRVGGGALTQAVDDGAAADEPLVAANDGWMLAGWSGDFSSVTDDLALAAVYIVPTNGVVVSGTYAGLSWQGIIDSSGVTLTSVSPTPAGEVRLPTYLHGLRVTGIGQYIFNNCTQITGVEIPSTITTIGSYAFAGCTGIERIVIPQTVSRIERNAFESCSNLREARLYGDNFIWQTFKNCTALGDVFIGKQVGGLYKTFESCTALSNVVFETGSMRTLLLYEPFISNPNLKSLHLPSRINLNGNGNVCCNCGNLVNLTMEGPGIYCRAENNLLLSADGTKLIGGASGLETFDIPASVTTIAYKATDGCNRLLELTLPDTVQHIERQALYCSSSIRTLRIGRGVKVIDAELTYLCPALSAVYFAGDAPTNDVSSIYSSVSAELMTFVTPSSTGWKELGSSELPSQWPVTGGYGRPIYYPAPSIITSTLPDATMNCSYSFALTADGGCPPYSWSLGESHYVEYPDEGAFDGEGGTAMGWKADEAKWTLALPFEFPFYGVLYSSVTVGSNGVLSFNGFNGYTANVSNFKANPMIAALWRDLKTNSGDIYVSSNANEVVVRWQATAFDGSGAYNFSVKLSKDGSIRFNYGSGNANGGWIGISSGKGATYLTSAKSMTGSMANATSIAFVLSGLPAGLTLTPTGEISGTPTATLPREFVVQLSCTNCPTVSKTLYLNIAKPPVVPVPDKAGLIIRICSLRQAMIMRPLHVCSRPVAAAPASTIPIGSLLHFIQLIEI